MNISKLREILRSDVTEVTFTKKNGEKRVMNCTLRSEFLPDMSGSQLSKPNDEVVTVWDTDANGWRSFRMDSILSVNTEYFNYVVD